MNPDTKMAPDYTVDDWNNDRELILTDGPGSEDAFSKAIEKWKERTEERFIKPMVKLNESGSKSGEGFSVVSLACILIDYLSRVDHGLVFQYKQIASEYLNIDKKEHPGNFRFSFETYQTMKWFPKFCKARLKMSDSLAQKFYIEVRSSLLHDAMTNANWVIRVGQADASISPGENGELVIDRTALVKEIRKIFESMAMTDYWKNRKIDFIRHIDHLCQMQHVHYFAYGNNMSVAKITDRMSGQYTDRRKATLKGYSLRYNKKSKDGSGKANVVETATSSVNGWLYEITTEQFDKIKEHEIHYGIEMLPVRLPDDGATVNALVFVAAPDSIEEGLEPTAEYRATIESNTWSADAT